MVEKRNTRNLILTNDGEDMQVQRVMMILGVNNKAEAFRQCLSIFLNEHPNLMTVVKSRKENDLLEDNITKGYRNALHNIKSEMIYLSDELITKDDIDEKNEIAAKIKLLKLSLESLTLARKEDYILNSILLKKDRLELEIKQRDSMLKELKVELSKQGLKHLINMQLFDRDK